MWFVPPAPRCFFGDIFSCRSNSADNKQTKVHDGLPIPQELLNRIALEQARLARSISEAYYERSTLQTNTTAPPTSDARCVAQPHDKRLTQHSTDVAPVDAANEADANDASEQTTAVPNGAVPLLTQEQAVAFAACLLAACWNALVNDTPARAEPLPPQTCPAAAQAESAQADEAQAHKRARDEDKHEEQRETKKARRSDCAPAATRVYNQKTNQETTMYCHQQQQPQPQHQQQLQPPQLQPLPRGEDTVLCTPLLSLSAASTPDSSISSPQSAQQITSGMTSMMCTLPAGLAEVFEAERACYQHGIAGPSSCCSTPRSRCSTPNLPVSPTVMPSSDFDTGSDTSIDLAPSLFALPEDQHHGLIGAAALMGPHDPEHESTLMPLFVDESVLLFDQHLSSHEQDFVF